MCKSYTFECKKCGGQEIGVRQIYEVIECFEPVDFDLRLAMAAMPPTGRIDWRNAESVDKDIGETLSTDFYCSECGEIAEEDEIKIANAKEQEQKTA